MSLYLFCFFPSTTTSHVVYADPIVSLPSLETVQLIEMPKLEPVAALETALQVLQPYGTYSNLYAPGNCTWGVASRLPIPNSWGNANNWAYAAAAEGYTVSAVPRVGAVAQTSGDSYLGHVAVVEAVNDDGSFLIWEENGAGLYSIGTRVTTTAEFPNFIYI